MQILRYLEMSNVAVQCAQTANCQFTHVHAVFLVFLMNSLVSDSDPEKP